MRIIKLVFNLILINLLNIFSKRENFRTPEPSQISEDLDQVNEYNTTDTNNMSVIYGITLYLISKIIPQERFENFSFLDLCCGPAIFRKKFSEIFHPQKTILVDLSENMLLKARKNFCSDKVECIIGNVTNLNFLEKNSVDFVSFMNAAHHMPNLDVVKKVFEECERVCSKDGYIFISDLVRQKTKKQTEIYLKTFS